MSSVIYPYGIYGMHVKIKTNLILPMVNMSIKSIFQMCLCFVFLHMHAIKMTHDIYDIINLRQAFPLLSERLAISRRNKIFKVFLILHCSYRGQL